MTLLFHLETTEQFDFSCEEVARQVISAALDYEHFPYEAEVSLTLVDNEAIREINREFRQIDAPTDVLSFPMIDYPAPGDFSALEETADVFHPQSGEALLGDIVISVPKVVEQAQAFGHSRKREYAFLIAHSMLHLMGYDHMTETEAAEGDSGGNPYSPDISGTSERNIPAGRIRGYRGAKGSYKEEL